MLFHLGHVAKEIGASLSQIWCTSFSRLKIIGFEWLSVNRINPIMVVHLTNTISLGHIDINNDAFSSLSRIWCTSFSDISIWIWITLYLFHDCLWIALTLWRLHIQQILFYLGHIDNEIEAYFSQLEITCIWYTYFPVRLNFFMWHYPFASQSVHLIDIHLPCVAHAGSKIHCDIHELQPSYDQFNVFVILLAAVEQFARRSIYFTFLGIFVLAFSGNGDIWLFTHEVVCQIRLDEW